MMEYSVRSQLVSLCDAGSCIGSSKMNYKGTAHGYEDLEGGGNKEYLANSDLATILKLNVNIGNCFSRRFWT